MAESENTQAEKMIQSWIEAMPDPELVEILLETITHLPADIAAFEAIVAEGDLQSVRDKAHSLKGKYGIVSMREFSALFRKAELEISTGTGDVQVIESIIREIKSLTASIPSHYFSRATRLTGHIAPAGLDEISPSEAELAAVEPSHNRCILLVDDEVNNRKLIRTILNREGFSVDTAGNGREALVLLSQQNYDLVLLDMVMPVMDGFSAITEIRSTPGLENLPVFAMTGMTREQEREKCLAAGCDAYISKPIKFDIFVRKIKDFFASQTP